MNNQALFPSKDKSKKIKFHLLQILFGALRVKLKSSKNYNDDEIYPWINDFEYMHYQKKMCSISLGPVVQN